MDSSTVIQIVILICLLALSAFFSSAETSLTMANKIRMRSLADEGNKRAKMVLWLSEHSSQMLTAILIGNNVVNLSASSLTTSIAYKFGGSAIVIANAAITILILLFGEITPKTTATLYPEKVSLIYSPIIKTFTRIMTPLIFLINLLSRGVLALLHIDPSAQSRTMTESELRTIVDVSHEDGVIESEEKEMIYNVFDLGDAKAKDVMVPRVHVTFADINSTYDELINILLYDNTKEFHIRDILRDAYFTYEYKNISELLVEMREAKFNIAIVLDEYGETAGLITLEDILEEIVGEIHDEYDEDEEDDVRELGTNEYIVEGSTNLDDLNDELGLQMESDDYDSLGGFIIEKLDRLPSEGDEVTTSDGVRLVVEKLDKNRIESVHVYLPPDWVHPDKEEN